MAFWGVVKPGQPFTHAPLNARSSFLLFTLTVLVRESYGEDIAETKTERSDKSEESEYGCSFIDDDDLEFVPSSQEFSGEGRHNHNDNENEDDANMLEGTNAVRGVELECKSGNRRGEKQKHELREELWQRGKDYRELIIP
ncbi:hypothetical protein J1N35_018218 [Gossypium stocksii]|uniref:Uncharacterized protein n=1 Tax=Gossypium stocksii TaxID=47602 RepID=A0A9D3VNJ2_9ROSI|nr:hypothetical protein J1N35_018218 [Gossypium stocksii]